MGWLVSQEEKEGKPSEKSRKDWRMSERRTGGGGGLLLVGTPSNVGGERITDTLFRCKYTVHSTGHPTHLFGGVRGDCDWRLRHGVDLVDDQAPLGAGKEELSRLVAAQAGGLLGHPHVAAHAAHGALKRREEAELTGSWKDEIVAPKPDNF